MTAPANEEQLVESQRQREAEALVGRERTVTFAVAGGFLAAAAAMALFLPSDRSPSLLTVAVLIGALTLASLVDFEVGSGQAVPLELVLVPMLFVLPAAWVPLAAAAAYLLAHLVNGRRRDAALQRMLVVIGSAWYAVGPALVLALAGEPAAAWDVWPVLLLAFTAQIACDATSAILQERIIFGTPPRQMIGFLRNAYAVDAVLAPLGLAVAIATVSQPALAVVVLPLMGLFAFFAKERRLQMDQAIKLAHAARDLSTAYRGTALLLGDVVEADDSYTGSHSRGVVDLVRGVALELGLDGEQLHRAEFTALLHDVGKVTIPKEIINKPGALDPNERAIIETHTIEGEKILERMGGLLKDVGELVRSCHERWDGAGYPDRLAGDDIPLIARIVCACDAYSAMTTDRPYRKALLKAEALAELERCSGTQFDPVVVPVLIAVAQRPALRADDEGDEYHLLAA